MDDFPHPDPQLEEAEQQRLFKAASKFIKDKDAEGLKAISGRIDKGNLGALIAISFRRVEAAIQATHNYYWALSRRGERRDRDKERSLEAKRAGAFEKFRTFSNILCDAGGEIGRSNKEGRNFLHKAALWGAADVIEWAVKERGFKDIEARIENDKPENGFTALHCACAEGNMDAALKLLDLGADFNALTPRGVKPEGLIRDRDLHDEFSTACGRIEAERKASHGPAPPGP